MTAVKLKVELSYGNEIGPGKIELLEHIAAAGSIAAAAKRMQMSYKRVWDLIEELNRGFQQPVISVQRGGPKGGGASLTQTGALIVQNYRAIEAITIS